MPRKTTIAQLKRELRKLVQKILKLQKRRDAAIAEAAKLDVEIKKLLGGAPPPKKRGRPPKKKVGRPRRKKKKPVKKRVSRKKAPPSLASHFDPSVVGNTSSTLGELALEVMKSHKSIPIDKLVKEIEKRGFKSKNTKQVLLMQLKRIGLKRDAKGNVAS